MYIMKINRNIISLVFRRETVKYIRNNTRKIQQKQALRNDYEGVRKLLF